MDRFARYGITALVVVLLGACGETSKLPPNGGVGPSPTLPEPTRTLLPTVNIAPAKRWSADQLPAPAQGLRVIALARELDHPRWIYVLPNGDVLVAETNAPPKEPPSGIRAWVMSQVMTKAGARVPSADRITLLRDENGDGVADRRSVFLKDLKSPFGMTLVGDMFYVAHADALWKYPYRSGAEQISEAGSKVVDLPAGRNHHWTKNVIASPDGSKLYVTVGSNSNVGENGMQEEEGRAAIWEVDAASGEHRIFASGLRNPNGLDWNPDTGALWTVVNERDELGNDLVPDYLTSVRKGGFYGWPYSYFGQHVDQRVSPPRPDLVAQAIVPDYALGSHVAPLGLVFVPRNQTTALPIATSTAPAEPSAPPASPTTALQAPGDLPSRFASGAFIGEHGSWNRRPMSGYHVVFVPFEKGVPSGPPVEVLTGFVDRDGNALGRPVGVAIDRSGALLVADDVGNTIWRVSVATQPENNPK
jgi:glucose/arabinose dehydrogenase